MSMLVLGMLSSCHQPAKTLQESLLPSAEVTVLDASNSSGCQYVLHPETGPDLLPVSFSTDPVSFYPEGVYRITYSLDSSSVFACTAKAVPIHIESCIPVRTGPPEGTGGIKPPRRHCAQTSDPYNTPWMSQIMDQLDPDKVTRYQMGATTVYGFQSRKGHYLFDCRGDLVCRAEPGDQPCETASALFDSVVILVRNY